MCENTTLTSNQKFITENKLSFLERENGIYKNPTSENGQILINIFAGDSATPRDIPGRNEACVSVNTGTRILLEDLFITAPNWKPGDWTQRDTATQWTITGSKTKH